MQIEKKSEALGMKVTGSVLEKIYKIAEEEDRPVGYIARELMLRGLALYEQDGKVRDSGPVVKQAPRTSSRGIRTVDIHLSDEPVTVRKRRTGS